MKNKKIIYSLITIVILLIVTLLSNSILFKIDVGELPTQFSLEEDSNLQMIFFDVGQADSSLIVDNGRTMLIDAGNNEDGTLLVEYLKQLGIKKIDYLIGTHAHEDHIGGMDDIINNFDVGTFFIPFVEKSKTQTYKDAEDAANDKNLNIANPDVGETFFIGDAGCTIKYINNAEPNNINNSSIVLEMTLGEDNYLFMGDSEKQVENNKDIEWQKVRVLKVGHHGSDTSSTESFIKMILPQIAIISVGQNNNYGHPANSVLEVLSKVCNEIYRTDKDATLFLVNENGINRVTKLQTKVDGNK